MQPGLRRLSLRRSGATGSAFAGLTAGQVIVATSATAAGGFASFTYDDTTAVLDLAKSLSAGTVTSKVRNTSNTATSSAQQLVEVAGASAANPFTTWSIAGVQAYSIGVQNASTGDPLIISAGATLPLVAATLGIAISSAGEVAIGGAPVSGTILALQGSGALDLSLISSGNHTNGVGLRIGALTTQVLRVLTYATTATGNNGFGEAKAGSVEFNTTSLTKMIFATGTSTSQMAIENGKPGMAAIPVNGQRAWVGGTIKTIQSDAGNITTGEDPLHSYTLPAAMLTADGQSVVVEAIVTFAANGVNKQAKLHFGGTAVGDTGVLVQNGGSVVFRARITRTSATAQRALCTMDAATHIAPLFTTPGETLANAIVVKLTGEGTNTDDLVNKITAIEWRAALN